MLAIFSHKELTVPKATVLGVAEVSETLVDSINEEKTGNTKSSTNWGKSKNDSLYKKLLPGKLDHLSPRERHVIESVLQKYAHVSRWGHYFKSTDVIEHKIIVTDPTSIRRPQYMTPFALRGEMESQVKNMHQKGVFETVILLGQLLRYSSPKMFGRKTEV